MRFHLLAVGVALLGLVGIGCDSSPETEPVTEANRSAHALSDVGELYRQYTFDKKKPPTTIADLTPLESLAPLGLKALQDGSVIARAGVVIEDVLEGPATKDPADDVLAYAKEVPSSGGPVLMHNRTIREMTADEFKAAKLAGTGDMAPGAPSKKH
ncbi:hypothetical protein [Paludisphaera rhizosphaerae]|uniref:hypothetical protein n=1 Tax=Paludisphaera rhizosphaerae TaxID=2711216 RepID=UPI0013EDD338|nr:hypothetical protein [Paludisphaera rhizosphaerae]